MAIAVFWLLLAGVSIAVGIRKADDGGRLIGELERALTPSALLKDETHRSLEEIRDSFAQADLLINNPLTAPVKLFPVLGRQVSSLGAISRTASKTTDIVLDALADALPLLSSDRIDPQERIPRIRHLSSIAARARARLDRLGYGPSRALIRPVERLRTRIVEKLERAKETLEAAVSISDGLVSFLEGPRRYLIAAANNAEMRAGSGMFLSWGILRTQDGSLSLEGLTSLPKLLPPGSGVAMDSDLAARWGWAEPNREWRNLGLSPRFDVNAELAARMWKTSTGETVDGMIAVDVSALRAVLLATGPIEVDGQVIDSENVEATILYEQYVDLAPDPAGDAARKDRAGRIAQATVNKLEEGEWEFARLLTTVSNAARGRHILAWSANPIEQGAWAKARIAGSLTHESLLVAVNNAGANKLDQYLSISGLLATTTERESTSVSLSLELKNTTPNWAPPYIVGEDPPSGTGRAVYTGILAVTLPYRASEPELVGPEEFLLSGPDGDSTVVGLRLVIPKGESQKIVIRFKLPSSDSVLRIEPSARIPPISWRFGRSAWEDYWGRELEIVSPNAR